ALQRARRAASAIADVEHPRSVIHRVSKSVCYRRICRGAARVADLYRQDQCVPRYAGNADAVVALGCGCSSYACPVSELIRRVGIISVNVVTWQQLAYEIRMSWGDATIANRNDHVRAERDVPSLKGLEFQQMPFVIVDDVGIIRRCAWRGNRVQLREFDVWIMLERLKDATA